MHKKSTIKLPRPIKVLTLNFHTKLPHYSPKKQIMWRFFADGKIFANFAD